VRADAVDVLLERKLGRVDADQDEPLIAVLLVPRAAVRSGPDPVDAGEGPEVERDDVSAEVVRRQRLRVEPLGCAIEGRDVALGGAAKLVEDAHRVVSVFVVGDWGGAFTAPVDIDCTTAGP
jgi:hypothetical protein